MKTVKILLVALALGFAGCASTFPSVNAMFSNERPTPKISGWNDVQSYDATGYQSITYIYSCYGGRYMAITYTRVAREFFFGRWEFPSVSSTIFR